MVTAVKISKFPNYIFARNIILLSTVNTKPILWSKRVVQKKGM